MTGYDDAACEVANGAVQQFGGRQWGDQCETSEVPVEDSESGDEGRRLLLAQNGRLHAHLHSMRDSKLAGALLAAHMKDEKRAGRVIKLEKPE